MIYPIEWVSLKKESARTEVACFLNGFDLRYDGDVDTTLVIRHPNGHIIATCSKAGNVFKCFAVLPDYQGENLSTLLVDALWNQLFEEGSDHAFLFTQPKNKGLFIQMGFVEVMTTQQVTLLVFGNYRIEQVLAHLQTQYALDAQKPYAALVMNCNPFTLGHRALVAQAAQENEQVLLFLVEEDRSFFPFSFRKEMVLAGTQDFPSVTVVPSTQYIISKTTFPTYFIKQVDDQLAAYTDLDAHIFGKYFCPLFHIGVRYVGTEVDDPVTDAYNDALLRVLPTYGVKVRVVRRFEKDDQVIRATLVREALAQQDWSTVQQFVPESTFRLLRRWNRKEGKD